MKKVGMIAIVFFLFSVGCSSNDTEKEEQFQKVDGIWTGNIEIPNQPITVVADFYYENDLSGDISIPVQGLNQFPLSTVSLKNENELIFMMELQGQRMTFDGSIQEDKIEGTVNQNGQQFPFVLRKGESTVSEEEADDFLHIETSEGLFYGELTLPEGGGPFPVMVIIPGSGSTDRNGNTAIGENNSLKLLAEGLAESNIASVRYDKRGAGKNQLVVLPEEQMHFDTFVDDAVKWVQLLKEDERFSDVGIIGHSQGSLVGILAAQEVEVDALVSIAGAGRTMDEVIYEQLETQAEDLMDEVDHILQQLKRGNRVDTVSPELQSVFRPSVQPFISSWMQYNPAEEMEKLDVPILLINGDNDIQVPVKDAEILHETNADSELLIIDKMNHVLKVAPEDVEENIETYQNPNLPLADGLLNGIVQFLEENNINE